MVHLGLNRDVIVHWWMINYEIILSLDGVMEDSGVSRPDGFLKEKLSVNE